MDLGLCVCRVHVQYAGHRLLFQPLVRGPLVCAGSGSQLSRSVGLGVAVARVEAQAVADGNAHNLHHANGSPKERLDECVPLLSVLPVFLSQRSVTSCRCYRSRPTVLGQPDVSGNQNSSATSKTSSVAVSPTALQNCSRAGSSTGIAASIASCESQWPTILICPLCLLTSQ